jgi:photosystem II stability/assembly factor-like uncharacterized protein
MAWLHAVHFIDQNRGWVAGSNGTLLNTNDGGRTWTRFRPPTQDNLRDVYFANAQSGWLLCERDLFKLRTNDEPRTYLLRSDDGGLSWVRVTLPGFDVSARLVRALFSDEDHGWAFGESGALFATRDGGANWARQILPTKHLVLGGTFADDTHGWLVGAGATALQTADGGVTWHSGIVRDGAGVRFTATSFVGKRLGWAVGTGGRIFATTDAGRTWTEQRSGVSVNLIDVKFVDAAEGWAAGAQGILLHTTDGGGHWTVSSAGTSHALERLFFVDHTHGWAVGFGGTIINYTPNASPPRLR